MNKIRRQQLTEIQAELEALKERIECLQQEEQDYFDNMPESLQGGEKGDKAQEHIDAIEYCANTLDDVISGITEIVEA